MLGIYSSTAQEQLPADNVPEVIPFSKNSFKKWAQVRDLTITPDQQSLFFTVQDTTARRSDIYEMRRLGPTWGVAKPASFSSEFDDLEPFASPDGQRIYFASSRPDGEEKTGDDFDIWYVEKAGSSWSDPVRLPAPVNGAGNEFYPSVSRKGNLYFTATRPEGQGKEDIYVAYWDLDHFKTPVPLQGGVNTEGYEFNAYVSPDESFLVFSGYEYDEGMGSGDLYYSFRQVNGEWSEAIHFPAPINSGGLDFCPWIDYERQKMYFTRKENAESRLYETNFSYLLETMR